ncbi:Mediator complex subunit 21 [Intoshia linei]|uniref:Mediator of RNA polymerase II transcription subunit 21 n=1 Tax=Intoshia linei TaxID=1819745 RepID=A0A177B7P0_9BILA|nr:Mediator complex subunit 21 [Intoshia linei]
MKDRLSQLAYSTNQLAIMMANSIGLVTENAKPVKFEGYDKHTPLNNDNKTNEDYTKLFSKLITRTANDIETLINSLPDEPGDNQNMTMMTLQSEQADISKKLNQLKVHVEKVHDEVDSNINVVCDLYLLTDKNKN